MDKQKYLEIVIMKTLKRADFKRIHDIACNDWKGKLIEWYGDKFALKDEIEVKDSEYALMRQACTNEQNDLFDSIFGKDMDITDKIKTVEDAIKYLGESDEDVKQLRLLQSVSHLSSYIISEQELVVITKALNEKEELDWDNTNQPKWFSWWYLGKNFRLYVVCNYYCYSNCSALLCFKNKKLAEYSAKQFKDKYKDYLNKV